MPRKRFKRNDGTGEMGGQDSFLDIVSNIVGILIILVMIAGVRAQNAPPEAAQTPPVPETPEIQAAPEKVDAATFRKIGEQYAAFKEKEKAVVDIRQSIDAIREQTESIGRRIRLQGMDHAELFELMTSARAGIELIAEEKGRENGERVEILRRLQEDEAKLVQLQRTKQWIMANRPKATVMENIPTPISKTVDDKEIHFRLLGGNIVYVPFNELFEKLNLEVVSSKNAYFKRKSSTGAVGPIEDFTMEFMLVSYDVAMRDAYGGGIGSRLEIEYAEMVPARDGLGQPLRDALASPDSRLMRKLKLYRQDIYTVTVWVYPDSFEEFRELKKYLYAKGYRVAARPKEFGEPICGSSHGTKSASQ